MKLFDYIFFRTYKFYLKKEEGIPIDRGIQSLSLIQGILVFNILMIIDFCFDVLSMVDIKYL